MKKWNMIIDVAECTNCQLCALSAMDEYVGNAWPGVAAPMPRHGHQWIDIKQKERGQAPMIDIAYVPTMCNHCDNAPCLAKGGDAVKKRADGMGHAAAVRCLGHRWVKILWKMWQTGTPYDEALHLRNQTEHGSWVIRLLPSPTPAR